MKSGITVVCTSLLCIFAAVQGGEAVPRLAVPPGFTASIYASGIRGARDLDVRDDGTVTLRGGDERFEIAPPSADAPITVMRVAPELDAAAAGDDTTVAVQSPDFVRMRWDAGSGELARAPGPAANAGIPVSARTMALARRFAQRRDADVALAPDGSLFVADSRAGAVWRIRRSTL